MDAVEAVPPAKPSQLRETLDKVKTKLPPSIATSVTVLELHASSLSKQLEQLSTTGQQQIEALRQNHLKPDQFLQQAFSVKNDTQLALNISLNVSINLADAGTNADSPEGILSKSVRSSTPSFCRTRFSNGDSRRSTSSSKSASTPRRQRTRPSPFPGPFSPSQDQSSSRPPSSPFPSSPSQ